jgi:hypothetical protein
MWKNRKTLRSKKGILLTGCPCTASEWKSGLVIEGRHFDYTLCTCSWVLRILVSSVNPKPPLCDPFQRTWIIFGSRRRRWIIPLFESLVRWSCGHLLLSRTNLIDDWIEFLCRVRKMRKYKFSCKIIWKWQVLSGGKLVLYSWYRCNNLHTAQKLASPRCIPNCHDNAFLGATLDEDYSDILVCAEPSSCHLMQEGIVYFCSEKDQERNENRYEEGHKVIWNAYKLWWRVGPHIKNSK